MFVGHAAVALAAKRAIPRVSLGVLMAATLALDFLWPVFALTGLERFSIVPGHTAVNPLRFDHYPWSHSLLMALLWGALAGGLVWRFLRGWREASVVGGLVVSHWALDAITHVPDLPLWPGSSPVVGLGLWRSLPAAMTVEGLLLAAGVFWYTQAGRPRGTMKRWSFAAMLLFMLVLWGAGPFSPPPPSTTAVSWAALALLVLPWWAARIDRSPAAELGTDRSLAT